MNIKSSWDAASAEKRDPIFSYQHAYTHKTIDSYSFEDFDLNVLNQTESKGGIRSVAKDVIYQGRNISENMAIPLTDKQHHITGYCIFDAGFKNRINIGTGMPTCHIGNTNSSCAVATDNIKLFLRLSKLNFTAAYHTKIDSAFEYLNDCVSELKPRVIATKNTPTHLDLKVHFDNDVNNLSDEEIKARLNDLVQTLKPAEYVDNVGAQKESTEWGELIPLDNSTTSKALPYPINSLPPLLQGAAKAIAEYVQAPMAMTAQCVIGAISHIAQTHVNAPHQFNTQGEPCSLFLLTEGQSGSRKSTSKSLADKAIMEYEREAYDQYKDAYQQWKTIQAGLPKADREAFLAENPPPSDPSTLFSDGTLEAVAGLFIDGALNNASISSDEAGQFFGGHTMKGDTRTQALGSYTKLFDDGSIQRTRSKSNLNGSGRAYDVRLTFNLQGQHEVLADALKDDVLREQGFLPRFILSVPENLAGTRLHDAEFEQKSANLDHRLIAYWERCKTLMDPCPQPLNTGVESDGRRVIQLSVEASKINRDFYNECEKEQGKGGKYEHIQPFASRASQLARRLATVFAFFQGEHEITDQTMQGACEIIKHSLGEWLRYADIESKKESDAQKLLNWLIKKCIDQSTDKIQYSTMQTSCPRPMSKNKQLLEITAQQLEDTNHMRIDAIIKKRLVALNPILLGKSV